MRCECGGLQFVCVYLLITFNNTSRLKLTTTIAIYLLLPILQTFCSQISPNIVLNTTYSVQSEVRCFVFNKSNFRVLKIIPFQLIDSAPITFSSAKFKRLVSTYPRVKKYEKRMAMT